MKHLVLAAALLLSAGAAQAADASRTAEAVLTAAATTTESTVIDGRLWRCFGTGCRAQAASNPTSQPIGRECRRVVAKLGEVSHYRSGKRTLTAAELQACNAGVAERAPTTELAGAR
jgi:hypothetical protein